jgi:hypothetical protein
MLFGVMALDPLTFVGAIAVLGVSRPRRVSFPRRGPRASTAGGPAQRVAAAGRFFMK